jgi:ribonuclease J
VLFRRQIPGNSLPSAVSRTILPVEYHDRHRSPGHDPRFRPSRQTEALYGWIRPEILLPVHGEMRHMREQGRLGKDAGIPKQVVQKNGDLVRLAPGKPGKFGEVRAGRLLLDGDIIAPADGMGMVMRRRLRTTASSRWRSLQ